MKDNRHDGIVVDLQGLLLQIVVMTFVVLSVPVVAQDTVRSLDEVVVSSQRPPATMRTAAPTQVVDSREIEKMGAVQLSDAVRQMAGIVLKDYGGVGGLKTVSARGLGSQFSTLTIDGVAVDNSQNGQVDLGRYLVGNAAYVSLNHGQAENLLQSARAYAAGNVISMESAEPSFFYAERNNVKIGVDAGSFGLFNPSALWEHKWSKRVKSSLWISRLQSNGNYPFTLYYTDSRRDSSSREYRQHSAMHMTTIDGALFYDGGRAGTLVGRVHYSGGMHQLPGDVVRYRSYPSAENTYEKAGYAQARWRVEHKKWKAQVVGKIQANYDMYEDSAYVQAANHYMSNNYHQREGYLSGSAVWHPVEWIDITAATDGDISMLKSNQRYRNDVHRQSVVAVVSVGATRGRWKGQATAVATMTNDVVSDISSNPQYKRLSPTASMRWVLTEQLTMRYFYKETFRVPTFSELYMFYSDPMKLHPERARQHNIGATYMGQHLSATSDAYFNRVIDKIMATPGQNMFYWRMENIGLVHIAGVDATADATIGSVMLHASYSFAYAVDKSDKQQKTYNCQIPYTPRHSGGGNLRWENRWLNVGASAMIVGHRYTMAQSSPANRQPAYCDIGLSIDRTFNLPWGELRVQAQVANLADVQYEVVKDYPMMGRNYRLSINYQL